MTLLDANVKIIHVRMFEGLSGDYTSVEFEDNNFALLSQVWGDKMRVGQTGCLYFIEDPLHTGVYTYFWEVADE